MWIPLVDSMRDSTLDLDSKCLSRLIPAELSVVTLGFGGLG